MKKFLLMIVLVGSLIIGACDSDAKIASRNVSQAADNFEVQRRVVFLNGITDTWILSIEGRCSIKADNLDKQLEVTCKYGPSSYKKHFLGLSDNVTYFAEQLELIDVSAYHYRVVFKPQAIVPDIDLRVDIEDGPRGQ